MSLDHTTVGKKRKRYSAFEKDVSVKLTGKLHHYLKEVRKAAKKSKTFETQRLVKRLKDLRKPVRDQEIVLDHVKDLETQLESLKKTDHERIAHLALSSKIRKDKKLASNDALIAALASATFSTINTNAEARHVKVESRLLSSKILAAEALSAVSGLKAVLEPDRTSEEHGDLRILETDDTKVGVEGEESDEEAEIDATPGWESSSSDDPGGEDAAEAAAFEKVVDEADDTIDDDGWESGSVGGIERSDSEDDDADSSVPPRKRLRQLSSQSNLRSSPPSDPEAASTFLPSLSVGYIKGNSDSDVDQSEDENTASGRKNRRGQRARQAIWEKKYGKNAKHVKKMRETAEAAATARSLGRRSDKGWEGRHQGDSRRNPTRVASTKHYAPKLSRDKPDRNPPSEKPTHPSWEAKKKLKEKESARIMPSQGKKIVFT